MKIQAKMVAKDLKPHVVKALRILHKRALLSFTSTKSMPGFGEGSAKLLVELKLAEAGNVEGLPGGIGYRLTDFGFAVVKALKERQ